MFFNRFKKSEHVVEDHPLIQHRGIFKRRLSLLQGVALVVSGTIGAGVLGVPFVVAKVGILVGCIYIVTLGLLMMGLNLLIGEVATCTRRELQVIGLAREYLGAWGAWVMTGFIYLMGAGVMTVYIIGEGTSLSALFGGDPFIWSIVFFAVASVCVFVGLRMIKVADLFLSIGLLLVIIIISILGAPYISSTHVEFNNFAYLLLPYGVILFSLSSTGVIPEAHTLLKHKDGLFKKTIIIASFICIGIYSLFAFVVVGVTGSHTTEIATVGLGNVIGNSVFVFGNIFAVLAMGTGFLMGGMALRDSLTWDYRIRPIISSLLVCIIPFLIFVAGLRSFIGLIDVIGGVLVSIDLIFVVFIYWRARQKGVLNNKKYHIHHALLLVPVLLLALAVGAVYSVFKLF
ncbi:MAG: aromatic amino acid transport family protein [Candidatus Magasanikbacteria bacterium]